MKWKKSGRKALLGTVGLLALLGGLYYGGKALGGAEAGEPAAAERPAYQFRAHFISYRPQESELWTRSYTEDPLNQPVFLALVHRLNRDLYNVRSPRGGWRYRSLAEVLVEGGLKPDAAALRSPDPAVVEKELNRLDERYRFQVTATLEGQAPLGELMVDHARTEPVALEQGGEPLEAPEAQVVYDVFLTMRIEKVYEDGYALRQWSRGVASKKESQFAKVPLGESKLGEAWTIPGCPVLVRDASFYSLEGVKYGEGEVVVPGHVILVTMNPSESPKER